MSNALSPALLSLLAYGAPALFEGTGDKDLHMGHVTSALLPTTFLFGGWRLRDYFVSPCRVWSCVVSWLCMWRPCSVPGRSGSHCRPARSPCSDMAYLLCYFLPDSLCGLRVVAGPVWTSDPRQGPEPWRAKETGGKLRNPRKPVWSWDEITDAAKG